MTDLLYLSDSYRTETDADVLECSRHGDVWLLRLDVTVFYPEGGGQPSDTGTITGPDGTARVRHVRMIDGHPVHECTIAGSIKIHDKVTCRIDWDRRYANMRIHSAGHVVHEAVRRIAEDLVPVRGDHGAHPFIEYTGTLPIDRKYPIESEAQRIVAADVPLTTRLVTPEELAALSPWVPAHLPAHKPLRIICVGDNPPVPDGGTQVRRTGEIGDITISGIENSHDRVKIRYAVSVPAAQDNPDTTEKTQSTGPVQAHVVTRMLLDAQSAALSSIGESELPEDLLRLEVLGPKSQFARAASAIRDVTPGDRTEIGKVINLVKSTITAALARRSTSQASDEQIQTDFDLTAPGIRPKMGSLHIVTQAIIDITRIFERIGFSRVRHPEVDWDWYPFESLNMPPDHPARDEWETFFLRFPGKPGSDPRKQKMVLTPHTSNGQVREMEKGKLPIRMINIARCYRRQIDVSHTPMFHQFEGLYIDRGVSIGHLKGVFDHFVRQFFGEGRVTRLRPFHFQFTEPSFEVDINCGVCLGTGKREDNTQCRLCKAGWLELGGAGMVHPVVLTNGGIDPDVYSGFAFGWGIERTSMMKSGTMIDDIRHLYGNDIRFLEQF